MTDREIERSERMLNHIGAQMDLMTGMPGLTPRFPPRYPRTIIQSGDVTMHNIHINNSTVGLLNTGYIGAVDSAVGAMHSGGDEPGAAAFRAFTEKLAELEDVDTGRKNQVLELLSVLASEGAAPKPNRRGAAMRALLTELATLTSGFASLAALHAQYAPAIAALFT
ncbi:MAG TPA: hypothetical protein VFE05_16870 [Longimicrobiaceae bacterium]|nr:hypothetical protein [Longimicrobiaceae bacterium]